MHLQGNFGKDAAVLAGLQHAKGNAAIIMDADLQHPPTMIHQLIEGFEEGYDQVVAKRNRKGNSVDEHTSLLIILSFRE